MKAAAELTVLGIETSCDETAAAIVTSDRQILSNIILSQIDEHRPYGGVVPEIAARAHIRYLDGLIKDALSEAGKTIEDLDAIAATAGPGLIGGVMVGLMTAKGIAAAAAKPFVGVNHLEGHALSARLSHNVPFPYLLLLVSGGHCQILNVQGVGSYRRLGTTVDDAVGEAFDKTAKLLRIGYPGGPEVERLARDGDPGAYALPRPMSGRAGCDFSFSGLKTAVKRVSETWPNSQGQDQEIADLCASFQAAVGDVLVDRLGNAIKSIRSSKPLESPLGSIVVAGGVAANLYLRERLERLARSNDLGFIAPPPDLCTDNAAMIAWAAVERLQAGLSDKLDLPARPRWPLDANAPPKTGAAVKA